MKKPDTLKIPAYQRKKSLIAKSRKKTRKPTTARRTTRTISNPFREMNLNRATSTATPSTITPPTATSQTSEIKEMALCGKCSGYFANIDVAIIRLTSPLRVGDRIIFKKERGLFEQPVHSIQIDNQDVSIAHSGKEIGIKVAMEPTIGTVVYKLIQ